MNRPRPLRLGAPALPRSERRRRREFVVRLVSAAAAMGLGVVLSFYIARLEYETAIEHARSHTTQDLALHRAKLEGELYKTLHLTRGVIAWVRAQPDVDPVLFEALAAEVVRDAPHIRNIALAPANEIRFIFPVAPNRVAMGLRYEETPDQWPAVQRAIEQRDTVVAGPVTLRQGGEALVARTPIFVETADDPAGYWGMASIVIDTVPMLDAAGLAEPAEAGRLALRGRDGLGAEGEVFFGAPEVFGGDRVVMDVSLPNGTWQIALRPDPIALTRAERRAGSARRAGVLLTLLFTALLYSLLRARHRSRALAGHDPLTGLANRRAMNAEVRARVQRARAGGASFALVAVDLDGFKAINDRHGHAAGDALLVELARRFEREVGEMGVVGRVGGDEFLIVLDGIADRSALRRRMDALQRSFREPVLHAGTPLTCGMSSGGAIWGLDATDVERLTRCADHRMYEQKSSRTLPREPAPSQPRYEA